MSSKFAGTQATKLERDMERLNKHVAEKVIHLTPPPIPYRATPVNRPAAQPAAISAPEPVAQRPFCDRCKIKSAMFTTPLCATCYQEYDHVEEAVRNMEKHEYSAAPVDLKHAVFTAILRAIKADRQEALVWLRDLIECDLANHAASVLTTPHEIDGYKEWLDEHRNAARRDDDVYDMVRHQSREW